MCLNDGKVACRLLRRRVGLTKKLSAELSTQSGSILFNHNPPVRGVDGGAVQSQSPVWVDGDIIRRFLFCNKTELNPSITTSGPLLKHKHLLCEHETGLHPRVAQRGKLLPRPMYDALVSLMLGERRMINGEDEYEGSEATSRFDEDFVNDCLITPDHNMYCKRCAESYKDELRKKIDTLTRLRQLYTELDPKTKKTMEIQDDTSMDSEGNETVFLVSQKFVTKFRAHVSDIVKSAVASELQSHGRNQGSRKSDDYCAGLDAVDLSEFDPNMVTTNDCSSSSEELDHFVNGSITCKHKHKITNENHRDLNILFSLFFFFVGEHGKCNTPHSRAVRRVSCDTWKQLLSWFPNAIAHEVGNGISNSSVRCELCEDEETKEEAFGDKLREWSKAATSSPLLCDIAKRKRSVEELSFKILETDTDDETFDRGPAYDVILVHSKDIESWRAALKAVKKHQGKTTSALTELLIDHLFSGGKGSSEPKKQIRNLFGRIYSSMCSLLCVDHSLPLERAIFKPDVDMKDPCIALFNSFVEALTPAEYAAFIGSVYDLGIILFSDESGEEATESTVDIFGSCPQHITSAMLRHLQRNYHPRVHSPLLPIGSESSCTPLDSPMDFDYLLKCHYSNGICRDADCNRKFDEENARFVTPEQTDQRRTNHVDLFSETVGESGQSFVEQKSEDSTFPLRVFEIDSGVELDTVVTSILGISSSGSTVAKSETTSLRRSSRKRKLTFPSRHVMREDSLQICPHYNVAAVRLFLYEKYPAFPLDRDLFLIIPKSRDENGTASSNHIDMTMEDTAMDSSSNTHYLTVDIPYGWNEKSVEDIVACIAEGKDFASNSALKKVFLCWRDENNEGKRKGAKTSREHTPIPNETLMDSLLEMSNVSSAVEETPAGEKKKSTRRTERGFRGTLLHSFAPCNSDESKISNDASPDDKPEEHMQKKENQIPNVDKPAAQAKKKESIVVLDDSDDENRLHQVCPRKQKPSAAPNESISILVSHTHTATTGKRDDGNRHLRSTIVDPKEEAVVKNIVHSLSKGSGMNSSVYLRCRDAVRWAISANSPEATISTLTDVALAKYYQESPM